MELHQLYGVHQPGDEWQEEDRAAQASIEGRRECQPNQFVEEDFLVIGDKLVPFHLPVAHQPARKPLVIIESPYSGDVVRNTEYARACLLDSLRRGEAPLASHLLHTQVLDDVRPDERELGIGAGLAWYRVAEKCVVYEDLGLSQGMVEGQVRALSHGVPVEYRRIKAWRDAA